MARTKVLRRLRAKRVMAQMKSRPQSSGATVANPVPKELMKRREWLDTDQGATDYAVAHVTIYPLSAADAAKGRKPTFEADFTVGFGRDQCRSNYGVSDYDIDDNNDSAAVTAYEDRMTKEVHNLRDMITEFAAAYDAAMAYRRQGYLMKTPSW